jgi:signal transduction histidine kinase/CheY-like chemotaxis protein
VTNTVAEPFVLVIDDEPGITRLCERLLSRAGFKIRALTDPMEGISQLEQDHFDLLLVDIRMPGIDGFEVIDRARRRQPDLAVVIMTGFGTVETAIEALRRGADGLVLKPFSAVELVQSVRRALLESQQKQDVMRLQTLRPLFTITESLFTETNHERLQNLLLDTILGHLHCSRAGMYQKSSCDQTFKLIAVRGDLPDQEPAVMEASLAGSASACGAPVIMNDEGPGDPSIQVIMKERELASVLCAPVALKEGENILMAARESGSPYFRESDLEIFAILARQAAVALENARLHTELRAYIRQVEDSQRALIQAEKMAIAGRLTASIAHEINNPLQSVRNCLHLAGRQELSLEDQQNYLGLAQAELERLMNTVQRMLDYYRPAALDRKAVDMNELIQRVLVLLSRQLEEANIRVKTRYSPRLRPVFVVADQAQQVLLNLCLNAMEAMPDGGTITIETFQRKILVEIVVEDTGPGVAPEQRERIFEPFVSTKEGGTGLGLAVSYGIISAHGGNLELVSPPGKGACFRITLPAGEVT